MTTQNLTPIPDLESIEKELQRQNILANRRIFHLGTPQNHFVLRGVGITRKSHAKSPAQRKQAKYSRRINRKK